MGAVKAIIADYAEAMGITFEDAMNSGLSVDEMSEAIERLATTKQSLTRFINRYITNQKSIDALITLSHGLMWSAETAQPVLEVAKQVSVELTKKMVGDSRSERLRQRAEAATPNGDTAEANQ